jgi:phosphatidylglycerol:prolipoprotein diacylglycerol transferase
VIPYIRVEPLTIDVKPFVLFGVSKLPIQPFGMLVALGVVIGHALATRRAKRLGLDVAAYHEFLGWVLVCGFVGAHVFDTIFYHPQEILKRPWSLLMIWEGLSSYGGFAGAVIGAFLWRAFDVKFKPLGPIVYPVSARKRPAPRPILPFIDTTLAVFPVAWIFGRTGCSVVHDHPGARAPEGAFFAVAYPPGPIDQIWDLNLLGGRIRHAVALQHGITPRWDLGLIEMLYTVVIAAIFALTWRRRLPIGAYVAATAVVYAPVRFFLDFLRIPATEGGDLRWAGLTMAQWASIAFFGLGLALALRVARRREDYPVFRAAPAETPSETLTPLDSAAPASSPAPSERPHPGSG